MRRSAMIGAIAVTIVVASAARSWAPTTTPAAIVVERAPGASNIYRRDYVGPAACGECHASNHARWRASLHAVMNQPADAPGAVIGDFKDATVAYGDGHARLSRDGGGFIMALERGPTTRRFRVTR